MIIGSGSPVKQCNNQQTPVSTTNVLSNQESQASQIHQTTINNWAAKINSIIDPKDKQVSRENLSLAINTIQDSINKNEANLEEKLNGVKKFMLENLNDIFDNPPFSNKNITKDISKNTENQINELYEALLFFCKQEKISSSPSSLTIEYSNDITIIRDKLGLEVSQLQLTTTTLAAYKYQLQIKAKLAMKNSNHPDKKKEFDKLIRNTSSFIKSYSTLLDSRSLSCLIRTMIRSTLRYQYSCQQDVLVIFDRVREEIEPNFRDSCIEIFRNEFSTCLADKSLYKDKDGCSLLIQYEKILDSATIKNIVQKRIDICLKVNAKGKVLNLEKAVTLLNLFWEDLEPATLANYINIIYANCFKSNSQGVATKCRLSKKLLDNLLLTLIYEGKREDYNRFTTKIQETISYQLEKNASVDIADLVAALETLVSCWEFLEKAQRINLLSQSINNCYLFSSVNKLPKLVEYPNLLDNLLAKLDIKERIKYLKMIIESCAKSINEKDSLADSAKLIFMKNLLLGYWNKLDIKERNKYLEMIIESCAKSINREDSLADQAKLKFMNNLLLGYWDELGSDFRHEKVCIAFDHALKAINRGNRAHADLAIDLLNTLSRKLPIDLFNQYLTKVVISCTNYSSGGTLPYDLAAAELLNTYWDRIIPTERNNIITNYLENCSNLNPDVRKPTFYTVEKFLNTLKEKIEPDSFKRYLEILLINYCLRTQEGTIPALRNASDLLKRHHGNISQNTSTNAIKLLIEYIASSKVNCKIEQLEEALNLLNLYIKLYLEKNQGNISLFKKAYDNLALLITPNISHTYTSEFLNILNKAEKYLINTDQAWYIVKMNAHFINNIESTNYNVEKLLRILLADHGKYIATPLFENELNRSTFELYQEKIEPFTFLDIGSIKLQIKEIIINTIHGKGSIPEHKFALKAVDYFITNEELAILPYFLEVFDRLNPFIISTLKDDSGYKRCYLDLFSKAKKYLIDTGSELSYRRRVNSLLLDFIQSDSLNTVNLLRGFLDNHDQYIDRRLIRDILQAPESDTKLAPKLYLVRAEIQQFADLDLDLLAQRINNIMPNPVGGKVDIHELKLVLKVLDHYIKKRNLAILPLFRKVFDSLDLFGISILENDSDLMSSYLDLFGKAYKVLIDNKHGIWFQEKLNSLSIKFEMSSYSPVLLEACANLGIDIQEIESRKQSLSFYLKAQPQQKKP